MSKRTEKERRAKFQLEADGFSIHTFELSKKYSFEEWNEIKEALYHAQSTNSKERIYRERGDGDEKNMEVHHYKKYHANGVRIFLERMKYKDNHSCYIRMIINPRKLVDPNSSYLGIFSTTEHCAEDIRESFFALFRGTPFDADMNSYKLRRIDFCTNIRCDKKKIFREIVRVLRKLPTPPKYKRIIHDDKDKKKKNKYNKHYIRFECDTRALVIYDKTYQLKENNLLTDYECHSAGVLRFEVCCERKYIREVEKKRDISEVTPLVEYFLESAEKSLIKHFKQCFQDVSFRKKDSLEKLISECGYSEKNKKAMLELIKTLVGTQSVDKAIEKLERRGMDMAGVLERFSKLGVSPIPLRKNFNGQELPSIRALLNGVAKGEVCVDYIKIKHR